MEKYKIINKLIEKFNFKSYLEIGLDNPSLNFEKIKCDLKESVDPYVDMMGNKITPKLEYLNSLTYRMASDEFFESIKDDKKYDFIFIDGLHYDKQVVKDIVNSMKHLSNNGIIMMHDCLPFMEEHQVYPADKSFMGAWTGNVWKTLPTIFNKLQKIEYCTIDTDWGLGILPKQEITFNVNDYSSEYIWDDFVKSRDELMHLISVEDFYKKYNLE